MDKKRLTVETFVETLVFGISHLAQRVEETFSKVLRQDPRDRAKVLIELVVFEAFFTSFYLVSLPMLPKSLSTMVVEELFRHLMDFLTPEDPEDASLLRDYIRNGLETYRQHVYMWIRKGEEGTLGKVFLQRVGVVQDPDPETVEKVETMLLTLEKVLRTWLKEEVLDRYEVVPA